MTSEDGQEVDFGRRREARKVRVVPTRTVILGMLAALATGGISVGTVARWAAQAFITEQIRTHDRDPESHASFIRATERLRQANDTSDAEKARLQSQLDQVARDVQATREAVARLEERMKGNGR